MEFQKKATIFVTSNYNNQMRAAPAIQKTAKKIMELLIVKIVKKAKEIYKSSTKRSRTEWYNAMRAAAAFIKNNEQIQALKTKLTAYITYNPTAEKNAMLSCIKAIGQDALELGNEFIASVCNSVCKFKNISEKQAYVISRFYVEQKLNYGYQGYFSLPIIK